MILWGRERERKRDRERGERKREKKEKYIERRNTQFLKLSGSGIGVCGKEGGQEERRANKGRETGILFWNEFHIYIYIL